MSISINKLQSNSNKKIQLQNKALIFLILIELLLLISILVENFLIPGIFFVSLLGISLLIYSIKQPHYFLYIFLLSILAGSVGKVDIAGKVPPILWVDILFPFMILILIILLYFNKEKVWNYLLLFYLVFLIWSCLSFFIAHDKLRALLIWKSYLGGFVVFLFALITITDYKKIINYFKVLSVWGLILAIIELYIIYSLGSIKLGIVGLFFNKNLLATSWGKSNYLATFYVLIIPIVTTLFFLSRPLNRKLLILFIMVVMVSALVLTLSRGGMIALGISIIILMTRLLRPRTFIPILIAIGLISLILILNPLTTVLIERINKAEHSLSYFTRINFYKDVWNIFLENPITGVGLGNLGYHSKFIVSVHASAHNIILGLLGETGIIGALIYLSLLIYISVICVVNYIKEKDKTIKLLLWSFISAFIGVVIHSMIEPNFEGFQFSIMFWSTLAIFIRLSNLNENEKIIFSKSIKS
ncbi:MAG: O-antigen ligase family protein [Ignavibacteria bacterium]|jgi:O-antigen ligase|nr:O-antigen ligase family protein [Ignavibacteria bacterium]MDH7527395.1 O-antigen ligase family protein [Ignavibacteria bacterium]